MGQEKTADSLAFFIIFMNPTSGQDKEVCFSEMSLHFNQSMYVSACSVVFGKVKCYVRKSTLCFDVKCFISDQ